VTGNIRIFCRAWPYQAKCDFRSW